MNELRPVTFGRRTHLLPAKVPRSARKPWPALVLAALVTSILGALMVPLFPQQPTSDYAETFVGFSSLHPETAKQHVMASIEPCLSDGARAFWSDTAVKAFAGEVLFKALSLKYADLTSDQRDAQFREWINSAAKQLTLDQQTQFRGLIDNGLHKEETGECLAAKVHGLIS